MQPNRSREGRLRRRWLACVAAATAVIVVSACSSDGDDSGQDGGNADDLVDAAFDQLDEVSGEVVDDTDIVFDAGSDTVTIAGIELTLPDLAEYVSTDSNFPIPPTWPTLARTTLVHSPRGSEVPEYGLAVLGQTTMATEADRRQSIVDQVWGANQMDEFPVVHDSAVSGDDGRTCWIEVRSDPLVLDDYEGTISLVIAAGSGIASFGVAVDNGNPGIDGPGIAADVVEQICRTRPEGL